MLDPELVLDLRLAVVEDPPRHVVVDVAILEDLHEGGAAVRGSPLERLLHVGDVPVDGARDERRPDP